MSWTYRVTLGPWRRTAAVPEEAWPERGLGTDAASVPPS